MTIDASILVGEFDGFAWVRCVGKGSFQNSQKLKEIAEGFLQRGLSCVVLDLGGCTGMDSTFMGTMAGLAMRLSKAGGALQVADVDERNRRSLEDLGLDFVLEIEPPTAVWRGKLEEIRSQLAVPGSTNGPNAKDQAKLVLEAHKTLADANDANAKKFANVVQLLEKEVAQQEGKKS